MKYWIFLFVFLSVLLFVPLESAAVDVTSCGTLNSPNTVYDLTENLTVSGSCISIAAAGITFNGHGNSITGQRTNQGVALSSSSHRVIVRDLVVDNFTQGIYVPFAIDVQIINNTIHDSVAFGIIASQVENFSVYNNRINLTGEKGMYVSSSTNVSLINNTVTSAGESGIYIPSGDNHTIINNTILLSGEEGMDISSKDVLVHNNVANNNSEGFYFSLSSNAIITNNTANDNTRSGFFIANYSHLMLLSNTARSNTKSGAVFHYADNATITNNTFSSNLNGLTINNSLRGAVMGNIMSSNSYTGIYTFLSNYTNITGNTVLESGGYGMLYYSSPYNKVINNSVDGSNYDGILFWNSGYNVVRENNVSSSSSGGIGFQADSILNNITENFISFNLGSGIYVEGSDNNTLSNNVLLRNEDGISLLEDANYNFFSSNNVSNSTRNAVVLRSASSSNRFSLDTLAYSGGDALVVNVSADNTFEVTTFLETNSSHYDVVLFDTPRTKFISLFSVGNYSLENASMELGNQYGNVYFLPSFNLTGFNFTPLFVVGTGRLWFDDTSAFNGSANISLYGSPAVGLSDVYIDKNGSVCSDCNAFTSFSASIVVFNVTSGGNYSLQGTSGGSSGGGGGGGGSSRNKVGSIYDYDTSLEKENFTVRLTEYDSALFMLEGEQHTLKVASLNDSFVAIEVSSPYTFYEVFSVGDKHAFDLNGDGANETLITLSSLAYRKATLTLGYLSFESPPVEQTLSADADDSVVSPPETLPSVEEEEKKMSVWIIVSILLLILLGGAFIAYKKVRYVDL